MADNLKIWDRFADIDPKFTKPITGKAYRGTSPNPQYVIRCLTELFGPVGIGFGWNVVAEEFLPIGDEVLHWCRIRFWHTDPGNGFDAYGQTKALMKTKRGLMLDEDAPKKSLTDAITKAASQIGVGANIFLGRWDDSKYVAEVNSEYRQAERGERAAPSHDDLVDRAMRSIAGAETMEALEAVWKRIAGHSQEITADQRVINAKDARKAALTPALADDEIPY